MEVARLSLCDRKNPDNKKNHCDDQEDSKNVPPILVGATAALVITEAVEVRLAISTKDTLVPGVTAALWVVVWRDHSQTGRFMKALKEVRCQIARAPIPSNRPNVGSTVAHCLV